jgi:hypothetical protein
VHREVPARRRCWADLNGAADAKDHYFPREECDRA